MRASTVEHERHLKVKYVKVGKVNVVDNKILTMPSTNKAWYKR